MIEKHTECTHSKTHSSTPLQHKGYKALPAQRIKHGQLTEIEDSVVEETPIALVYNGISHAVMMATPLDLAYFAKGFSISEGIIPNLDSLYDLEIINHEQGIEVQMQIATESFVKLKQHRRTLEGRTGCGICGIESLQQIPSLLNRIDTMLNPTWLDNLPTLFKAIKQHQPISTLTGGAHAAAWVEQDNISITFEDVGRHNALDKLLGYLATHQKAIDQGFVFMTSRASYELVRKCIHFNIALLATISAPTTQAIKLAKGSGMTLASFCRDSGYVLYTH